MSPLKSGWPFGADSEVIGAAFAFGDMMSRRWVRGAELLWVSVRFSEMRNGSLERCFS